MSYKCPLTRKERNKQWYQNNKETCCLRDKARHRRNQVTLDEIKSAIGCYVCGECDPDVLDLHHRDPQQKSFSITPSLLKHKDFHTELDKCLCLCANHHRKAHRIYGKTSIIGEDELDAFR